MTAWRWIQGRVSKCCSGQLGATIAEEQAPWFLNGPAGRVDQLSFLQSPTCVGHWQAAARCWSEVDLVHPLARTVTRHAYEPLTGRRPVAGSPGQRPRP